jgi:AraC-like DNA-binding protein
VSADPPRTPLVLPEPTRRDPAWQSPAHLPPDPLPLRLDHLFLREADPAWTVEPHAHAELFQWYACVHGTMLVHADGRELMLSAERSVLVLPGRDRDVRNRGRACGYLVALFRWHGPTLDPLAHQVLDLPGPLTTDFVALIDELRNGIADDTGMMRRVLLARVLLGLVRASGERVVVRGHSAREQRDAVARAEAHMRQHLGRTLTRGEIARAAHLSESHLARVMRAATGRTVNERLTELRLEQAKRLLLETPWSMNRIASEVGFSSWSHFSRLFHRRVGLAPSDWRRERNRVTV